MRFIESDENLCMRGDALEEAIHDDIKLGLVPFWVSFLDTKKRKSSILCLDLSCI